MAHLPQQRSRAHEGTLAIQGGAGGGNWSSLHHRLPADRAFPHCAGATSATDVGRSGHRLSSLRVGVDLPVSLPADQRDPLARRVPRRSAAIRQGFSASFDCQLRGLHRLADTRAQAARGGSARNVLVTSAVRCPMQLAAIAPRRPSGLYARIWKPNRGQRGTAGTNADLRCLGRAHYVQRRRDEGALRRRYCRRHRARPWGTPLGLGRGASWLPRSEFAAAVGGCSMRG